MDFAMMQRKMTQVFEECHELRVAGQKEYAHEGQDAFRNFNSIAAELKTDRKAVLWVYAKKHMDGIAAYIAGHRPQRENVRGRINDLIVYMTLLRGMLDEEEQEAERKYLQDLAEGQSNNPELGPRSMAAAGLGGKPGTIVPVKRP